MSDISAGGNEIENIRVDLDFRVNGEEAAAQALKRLQDAINGLDTATRKLSSRELKVFQAAVKDVNAEVQRLNSSQGMFGFTKDVKKNADEWKAWKKEVKKVGDPFTAKISSGRQVIQNYKNIKKELESTTSVGKATFATFHALEGGQPTFFKTIDSSNQVRVSAGLARLNMESLGATMKNTGTRAQWTGRQMISGITLPLAGVVTASLAAYAAFNRQMMQLKKVTEYKDDYKALTKEIDNLTSSYGISSTAAASLFTEIAALGLRGSAIPEMADAVSQLSLVGGIDTTNAMNFFRAVSAIYNDGSIQKTTESMAQLSAISDDTAITLSDLSKGIPLIGPVMKDLGFTVGGTAAALAGMYRRGVPVTEGANAIKFAFMRLVNPTKQAKAVIDKLGISFFNADGSAKDATATLQEMSTKLMTTMNAEERISALGYMVGNRQSARILSLVEDVHLGTQELSAAQADGVVTAAELSVMQSDYAKALVATGEAAGSTAEPMSRYNKALKQIQDDPGTGLKIIKGEFQIIMRNLGDALAPAFISIAGKVNDFLSLLVNSPASVKYLIIALGSIVAAMGPVNYVFGMFKLSMGNATIAAAKLLPKLQLITKEQARMALVSGRTDIVQAGEQYMIEPTSRKERISKRKVRKTKGELSVATLESLDETAAGGGASALAAAQDEMIEKEAELVLANQILAGSEAELAAATDATTVATEKKTKAQLKNEAAEKRKAQKTKYQSGIDAAKQRKEEIDAKKKTQFQSPLDQALQSSRKKASEESAAKKTIEQSQAAAKADRDEQLRIAQQKRDDIIAEAKKRKDLEDLARKQKIASDAKAAKEEAAKSFDASRGKAYGEGTPKRLSALDLVRQKQIEIEERGAKRLAGIEAAKYELAKRNSALVIQDFKTGVKDGMQKASITKRLEKNQAILRETTKASQYKFDERIGGYRDIATGKKVSKFDVAEEFLDPTDKYKFDPKAGRYRLAKTGEFVKKEVVDMELRNKSQYYFDEQLLKWTKRTADGKFKIISEAAMQEELFLERARKARLASTDPLTLIQQMKRDQALLAGETSPTGPRSRPQTPKYILDQVKEAQAAQRKQRRLGGIEAAKERLRENNENARKQRVQDAIDARRAALDASKKPSTRATPQFVIDQIKKTQATERNTRRLASIEAAKERLNEIKRQRVQEMREGFIGGVEQNIEAKKRRDFASRSRWYDEIPQKTPRRNIKTFAGDALEKGKTGRIASLAIAGKEKSVSAVGKPIQKVIGLVTRLATMGLGPLLAALGSIAATAAIAVVAISAIVAVVVGLIFFFKALRMNWDSIVKAMKPGIDAIKKGFEEFKKSIGKVVDKFKEIFGQLGSGNNDAAKTQSVFEGIGKVISSVMEKIGEGIAFVGKIVEWLMPLFETIFYQAKDMVGLVASLFTGQWSDAWNYFVGIVYEIIRPLVMALEKITGVVVGMVARIVQVIASMLEGADFALSKIGINAAGDAAKAMRGWQNSMEGYAKDPGWIKTMDAKYRSGLGGMFGDAANTENQGKADDAGKLLGDTLGDSFSEAASDSGGDWMEGWVSAVFSRVGKALDKIRKSASEAIDKAQKEALKKYDDQIEAIDKQQKAEEKLAKTQEYLAKRKEILDKKAIDSDNYKRERALAIYEGRYNDARMLDLAQQTSSQESSKSLVELDRTRSKELLDEQRTDKKEQIKIEQDAAKERFDIQRQSLEDAIALITEYSPKTIEEFDLMLTQINTLLESNAVTWPDHAETALARFAEIFKQSNEDIRQNFYESGKSSVTDWMRGAAEVDVQEILRQGLNNGSGGSEGDTGGDTATPTGETPSASQTPPVFTEEALRTWIGTGAGFGADNQGIHSTAQQAMDAEAAARSFGFGDYIDQLKTATRYDLPLAQRQLVDTIKDQIRRGDMQNQGTEEFVMAQTEYASELDAAARGLTAMTASAVKPEESSGKPSEAPTSPSGQIVEWVGKLFKSDSKVWQGTYEEAMDQFGETTLSTVNDWTKIWSGTKKTTETITDSNGKMWFRVGNKIVDISGNVAQSYDRSTQRMVDNNGKLLGTTENLGTTAEDIFRNMVANGIDPTTEAGKEYLAKINEIGGAMGQLPDGKTYVFHMDINTEEFWRNAAAVTKWVQSAAGQTQTAAMFGRSIVRVGDSWFSQDADNPAAAMTFMRKLNAAESGGAPFQGMATGGMIKYATGGVMKYAEGGVKGLVQNKTNGILANIGEGGYDEYVITTDPAYRASNLGYLSAAAAQLGVKSRANAAVKASYASMSMAAPAASGGGGGGGYSAPSNINICVDTFIGEEQWFAEMAKKYNMTVVPRQRKIDGQQRRVISTYNDRYSIK